MKNKEIRTKRILPTNIITNNVRKTHSYKNFRNNWKYVQWQQKHTKKKFWKIACKQSSKNISAKLPKSSKNSQTLKLFLSTFKISVSFSRSVYEIAHELKPGHLSSGFIFSSLFSEEHSDVPFSFHLISLLKLISKGFSPFPIFLWPSSLIHSFKPSNVFVYSFRLTQVPAFIYTD